MEGQGAQLSSEEWRRGFRSEGLDGCDRRRTGCREEYPLWNATSNYILKGLGL